MYRFQSSIDQEKIEEFQKPKILYIINNALIPKRKSLAIKQYTSNNSETNEEVELLLRGLMK